MKYTITDSVLKLGRELSIIIKGKVKNTVASITNQMKKYDPILIVIAILKINNITNK